MVPFLDLKRQHVAIRSSIDAAIAKVIDNTAFIGGEEVKNFEAEVARFLRAQHAIGLNSGTEALALGLRVLGVLPGDEVVVPAFSFVATASVVAGLGATPVFADVDLDTFCLDPESFQSAVTRRTKAVIPVHLYGQTADMDGILRVARKRKIAVLEDACQAIGARYRGKWAGTLGDIAAFSFYPTKNLAAMGDGGLATCTDRDLAEKLRLMRDHGQTVKYQHATWGTNSRLDALQAAVLRLKLRQLNNWNSARGRIASRYAEELGGTPLILPKVAEFRDHVWHLYTVRVPGGKRDALREFLTERGIASAVHYSIPLHRQPCFAFLPQRSAPRAERLCNEVLSLPMFPALREDEQEAVVQAIRAFPF